MSATTPLRLAILISGRGSNMEALASACESGLLAGLSEINTGGHPPVVAGSRYTIFRCRRFHFTHGFQRVLQGRALRRLYHNDQISLVIFRNESSRNFLVQKIRPNQGH